MNMDKNEKVWYNSVIDACKKYNIPVKEKTVLDDDDFNFIKNLNPELIISLNWRRLIPKNIYQLPIKGTINIHAGKLPEYRGFAPINWALINGETEIGITAHYLEDTPDTGDIVHQEIIPVENNNNAFDVYQKALDVLPKVILKSVTNIENDNVNVISQKNLQGFLCVKRFPEDGKINWSQNRINIHNLIRALSDPFPNAFCFHKGDKILIKKSKLLENDIRGSPGRVYAIRKDGIIVTCGMEYDKNQALLITEISVNEKVMNPKEYFQTLWTTLE